MSYVLSWSTFPRHLLWTCVSAVLLCVGCGGSGDGGAEPDGADESGTVVVSDDGLSDDGVAPDVNDDGQETVRGDSDGVESERREDDVADDHDASSGDPGPDDSGQTEDAANQVADEGDDELDVADGDREDDEDDEDVEQETDDDAALGDDAPPVEIDESEPPEDELVGTEADDAGALSGDGPCPAQPPEVGAPCETIAALCTYGESTFVECREAFTCNFNSAWQATRAHNSSLCQHTEAEQCPASPPEGSCDVTWAQCAYPDAACTCVGEQTQACSGDGCQDLDPPIPQQWRCRGQVPECSLSPPNAGAPCEDSTPNCVYGDDCVGIFTRCVDGFIQWEANLCA